jgi:hypothetical protein
MRRINAMKERFTKMMMGLISLLLLLNLLAFLFYPSVSPFAIASDGFEAVPSTNPQSLGFMGNGVSVVCSNDGKYVYAAGNRNVFRSVDYGKAGSWQVVLSD